MSPLLASSTPSPPPSRRHILTAVGTAAAVVAGLGKAAFADTLLGAGGPPLTAATFGPLVNRYFLIENGASVTQLRLVQVVELPRGNRPGSLPDPFSLIFTSPWNETLAAKTYAVENRAIGRVAMFITPVGNHLYEAPFN